MSARATFGSTRIHIVLARQPQSIVRGLWKRRHQDLYHSPASTSLHSCPKTLLKASLEELEIPHIDAEPRSSVISLRHISHILPTIYKPPHERGMASPSLGSIFFATGNKNKIREASTALRAAAVTLVRSERIRRGSRPALDAR